MYDLKMPFTNIR